MTCPQSRFPTFATPLVLAALLTAVSASGPAAKGHVGKVVVVVANRLLLSDLDDPALPMVSRMMREGAVGLLSPTCLGPKSEASVVLTAQMGSPTRAGAWMRECYDVDEIVPGDQRAGDAYHVRTGRRAPNGSAVFLGVGQAAREAASVGEQELIGGLAEAIGKAGGKTCAIGSADALPDLIDRTSAVLAADAGGLIDVGWLRAPGGSTVRDSQGKAERIRGFLSDNGRLREMALSCLRQADLVVVDFGDTSRLEEYKTGLTDSAYARHKAATLADLDQLLGRLVCAPEAAEAVIVLVSFSPPVDGSWDSMTPVLVYPLHSAGLLTSPTTRTQGVIAASDFAPTVLRLMRIPSAAPMAGRPASPVPVVDERAALREIDTRVTANHAMLVPLMWAIAGFTAVVVLGSGAILAFGLRAPRWLILLLRGGILVGASFGLAMLLAVLAPPGPRPYIVAFAALSILVALIGCLIGGAWSRRAGVSAPAHAAPVVVVYLMTVAVVVADAFAGGALCRFAAPSSFYISGLRFYGIGNEYAALLIFMCACSVLFTPARVRVWAAPLLGGVVVISLGTGCFGANYGATAAAVVTFVTLSAAVRANALRPAHVLWALAAGLVAVVAFAELDWRLAGASGSHAGRIAGSAECAVCGVALRKALMNLRLTFGSNAWRLYALFAPLLVMWIWGIQAKLRKLFASDPGMMPGLRALWVGAAVAYAANDSGVVMACLMMAVTVAILVYSLLDDRLRSEARVCQG